MWTTRGGIIYYMERGWGESRREVGVKESIAPAGQLANCKYPNQQVHPESVINEKWRNCTTMTARQDSKRRARGEMQRPRANLSSVRRRCRLSVLSPRVSDRGMYGYGCPMTDAK